MGSEAVLLGVFHPKPDDVGDVSEPKWTLIEDKDGRPIKDRLIRWGDGHWQVDTRSLSINGDDDLHLYSQLEHAANQDEFPS